MKRMLGLLFILIISVIPVGADTSTIVDSLGAATPSTQFSVFGTGGCANGIGSTQFVGPEFTLTQPTVITEIGGFFVNCGFISGVPQCPEIAQFVVQIRPSTNGVPDPSIILASYPLSKNDNVFVATYQSVGIDLPLGAGTYFALFAPLQEDMGGYVVGSATDPFLYQAGLVPWGSLNLSTGASTFEGLCNDAVRILGTPIVPFAAFTAKLEITLRPRVEDAFNLTSSFTLGAASNGIDPLTEDVTLTLTGGTGAFTTTIPAGSFKKDEQQHLDNLRRKDSLRGAATTEISVRLRNYSASHFESSAERGRFEFEGTINDVSCRRRLSGLAVIDSYARWKVSTLI